MYATCLFCGSSLGTNEAIETFSVGSRVAFDAWQGRLWAVCARCGRWNLAPLEERWEAVEAAERLFVDTRTRVQSENIGLCRLPDGTCLVRVGKALPGELAAWRYGSQLVARRRRGNLVATAVGAGTLAIVAGIPLLVSAGLPVVGLQVGVRGIDFYNARRRRLRVVHRVPADLSPTGQALELRRVHLHYAALVQHRDGSVGVSLPVPDDLSWFTGRTRSVEPSPDQPRIHLAGAGAERVLGRAMSDFNQHGATEKEVRQALDAIAAAGGAHGFMRQVAATGAAIANPEARLRPPSLRQIAGTFRGEIIPVRKYGAFTTPDGRPRLDATRALALEMALNDEAERRALEGELAALEAAWREAEEIARIADALPDRSREASRA